MTIKSIIIDIVPILKAQEVEKASVFGSFAKGCATEKSDIDILVQLKKDKSLLDLVGLKLDLEAKLGRKVDLLTYQSINPYLKQIIFDEQQVIYERS